MGGCTVSTLSGNCLFKIVVISARACMCTFFKPCFGSSGQIVEGKIKYNILQCQIWEIDYKENPISINTV